MNTLFWFFLLGMLIGLILYKFIDLFKIRGWVKSILYLVDIYLCFTFANLIRPPLAFTSFLLGALLIQLITAIRYPYVEVQKLPD